MRIRLGLHSGYIPLRGPTRSSTSQVSPILLVLYFTFQFDQSVLGIGLDDDSVILYNMNQREKIYK